MPCHCLRALKLRSTCFAPLEPSRLAGRRPPAGRVHALPVGLPVVLFGDRAWDAAVPEVFPVALRGIGLVGQGLLRTGPERPGGFGPQGVQEVFEHREIAGLPGSNRHHQPALLPLHQTVDLGPRPAAGRADGASGGSPSTFLSIDTLPCAARGLVRCWWARLIVESTDTPRSSSPRLSAWPGRTASTVFQEPMFPVESAAYRRWPFHSVLFEPKCSGRSLRGLPTRWREMLP